MQNEGHATTHLFPATYVNIVVTNLMYACFVINLDENFED